MPKVIFSPGCFDSFEGTQEELDALIAEITALAESGALEENSQELTEEVFAELDPEDQARLLAALDHDELAPPRSLH